MFLKWTSIRSHNKWGGFNLFILWTFFMVAMYTLPFSRLGGDLYIEQQWYINYASGFIRRGLFGQFVLWQDVTLDSLYIFFNIVIAVLFFLYTLLIYKNIGLPNSKNIYTWMVLVSSPLFYSALNKLNGRFDLLFTSTLVLFFYLRNTKLVSFLFFILLIPFALIHELWLVLYVPVYLILDRERFSLIWQKTAVVAWVLCAVLLYLLTYKSITDVTALCSILIDRVGVVCESAVHLETSLQDILGATTQVVSYGHESFLVGVLASIFEWKITFLYILVCAAPVIFVLFCSENKLQIPTSKLSAAFLVLLCLSIIALDWGRFIVDIFQLVIFYYLINFKISTNRLTDYKVTIPLILVNLITVKVVFTRISIDQIRDLYSIF